jgi:hypothetical protein
LDKIAAKKKNSAYAFCFLGGLYSLKQCLALQIHNRNLLITHPTQLLVDSFITSKEESLMGIDEKLTKDWRDENQIPDTDGIEEMREDLKRARAESSVSVAGRARKSQRQ